MRRKLLQYQQTFATRKRGSPTLVAKDGNPDLGKCGGRMDEEKKWCSLGHRGRRRRSTNLQLHVGRQLLVHVTFERTFGTDATRSY